MRSILAILLLCLLASPGTAQSRIETLVAATNPCGGLKTKVGIFTVGVDRLKAVSIPTVSVLVSGDTATLGANGRLTCATSDNATVKGDASATVDANAQVDLATCRVIDGQIFLSGFGGTFGPILSAAKPQLEAALLGALTKALQDACSDLVTPG